MVKDALQEAYCAVAQVRNPDGIENLRAYFCRVLIRKIHRLPGQLGAILVDDFEGLADACQRESGDRRLARPFNETVNTNLLAWSWLRRLADDREAFADTVPGRSPGPGRYRKVIVTAAERVIRSNVSGDIGDADSDPALIAAYPEWFAEEGLSADNAYQRLSRARADVRNLLRTIIDRGELYS